MRTSDVVAFIRNRERHRIAREQGKWRSAAKPNPIISQFRFCNVRRNDDAVTKWVHENYLKPWREERHLWFALLVARLFNRPEVLELIGPYLLPFEGNTIRQMLSERAASGEKNFNAAYIVSTNGVAKDKVHYIIDNVLGVAWQQRERIADLIERADRLDVVHVALLSLPAVGSFIAAQVVADLKYADPNKWTDFNTFAASGPGSKRGLNRVTSRPVNAGWKEVVFRKELLALRDAVNARLTGWEPITAQDIQNCLCEFDKYERFRLKEGEPKQLYDATKYMDAYALRRLLEDFNKERNK